jgi:Spy/CpxP family protein refolding chaperone
MAGFVHIFEEQDMSEQTVDKQPRCPDSGRHWGRGVRLTIAALALVGVGAALGAAATAQAARVGGWHGMGHRWGHAATEEQARERAMDGAAWVLGRLDASAEQQTRINEIVSALVGDLYPLRAQQREVRRQLITELARPQIDARALEGIRADGITMVDAASKSLADAVVDTADVLTTEQREELARLIGRHRR